LTTTRAGPQGHAGLFHLKGFELFSSQRRGGDLAIIHDEGPGTAASQSSDEFSFKESLLPRLAHCDGGVIEYSIEDHLLRHAVYRPDELGEYGRSTENRNSSRIPPSENPQQTFHPECDRPRPEREPRGFP